jgi:hypothetical protein
MDVARPGPQIVNPEAHDARVNGLARQRLPKRIEECREDRDDVYSHVGARR